MSLLITQSLLNAYQYQFTNFFDIYEKEESAQQAEARARDDFISTLKREAKPTTEAMQRGIDFENLVVRICRGIPIDPDPQLVKWIPGAEQMADIVRGGSFQTALSAPLTIGNTEFLLYGRLDVLKNGTVYDIKFSGRYEYGKFIDSPQHPMYLALVPEAHTFTYLVYCDGFVYEESYRREDTRPIEPIVSEFITSISNMGLLPLYEENWKSQ
jgi:hypothetical protein